MLEISQKSGGNSKGLVLGITAIFIMLAGVYVLITTFAPATREPLLTGKPADETKERLDGPAGTLGDRLYIPQINVDVAIVAGNDSSALEQGAWHRKPESGNPTEGGNFVLSAHRFVMSFTPQGTAQKSPFYNIGSLSVGDRLVVDYKKTRYEYEITKKYNATPSSTEIEARTDEPRLTLYSCTLNGSGDGRDVIEAVLKS